MAAQHAWRADRAAAFSAMEAVFGHAQGLGDHRRRDRPRPQQARRRPGHVDHGRLQTDRAGAVIDDQGHAIA